MKQPDIVEQLRFMEKVAIGPFGATAGNAADEIERLRALVKDLADDECDMDHRARVVARAALKDTKP